MGNIVLLDDLTINKIAAGEVIERPASVVKELMENSIDAGADNISVEIRNGGISYIRITDNGKGFAADDLEIAFERHATSKIRKADDLETVTTMGFRGEALASIAAISKVELVTKTEDSEVGHKIVVEGGKVISKEEIGCPKGSSITIENLFYNTPVRYKFLKKDFTESGYIEDAISRIALVNPNIAIKFSNSGKTVIQTSGNGNIKDIVYGIYGKDIAENLINVEYSFEDMTVTGVIGKPGIARSNRSNQIFFVNKRYVKDKTLTSSAEQGFKGLLGLGKYAFLILNIEMDPHKLDVNVHPAKMEVRFQEENKVFKLVYHAIKEALVKSNLIEPDIKTSGEDLVKNNYLNEIEKIDSEKQDDVASNEASEGKGIGNFIKNILNGSKNEFATNEENLVEQVYRDKLQQERLFCNVQNIGSDVTTNHDNSLISKVQEKIDSTSKNNEANEIQEKQNDNTLGKMDSGTELKDIDSKDITTEQKELEKKDYISSKDLGLNGEEYKGNTNLERLIKELDANLEKLNLKPRTFDSEDFYNYQQLDSSIQNIESTQQENLSEKNSVNIPSLEKEEKINNLSIQSDNSSSENISDIQNEIDKVQNQDNLSTNIDINKIVENEKTQDAVENKTIENTNESEITQQQVENHKQLSTQIDQYLEKNKNNINEEQEKTDESNTIGKSGETEENKEPEINFEEMYAKMFGTKISNRNKVEEEAENGYAVKQEDLRTVEKYSLFTNSSVYSKPAYKFIGIIFESNIIIEYEREMYIINQQAANERILYEKIKKNYYSDAKKDSQLMLLPDIINLTHREMGIAQDNIQLFKQAGFDLEEFGENTIKLSGVPGICMDLDTKQLFLEILNEINTVARTAKQEIEEKFIETIARKAAEKVKMALTIQEIDNLMMELLALPQPFESPQGNPTAIRMSKADIEKKFSRR